MDLPRILVADDDRATLTRVERLLSGRFNVVGAVEDGATLLRAAATLNPDVLVVDIGMPVLNGIEAVRRYKATNGSGRVLFLSNHLDPDMVEAAIECGAEGFVPKTHAAEELVPAVAELVQGGTYFSRALPALTSEV